MNKATDKDDGNPSSTLLTMPIEYPQRILSDRNQGLNSEDLDQFVGGTHEGIKRGLKKICVDHKEACVSFDFVNVLFRNGVETWKPCT